MTLPTDRDERTAIVIGDRAIGEGHGPFLIAEIAQAHDGSLGLAHSFIDAAAEAGADAVKFQTHIAAAESSPKEPFRIKFSYEDQTRYDYWKRMEFRAEQWAGLAKHASERGLEFLSSAFSTEAVALLTKIGMPAWKIGSGESGNHLLWRAMLENGAPFLLSTGMSPMAEIEESLAWIKSHHRQVALFQCTTMYPTPLDRVGLNVLERFHHFQCPLGLSDHSGTIYPALAAMARGCSLIEVHVTFDRAMFGPDSSSSLTFAELKELRRAADAFSTMDLSPVDKDLMAEELKELRAMFGKSLCAKQDLPAGTLLDQDMLWARKPADGISVRSLDEVLGRSLARPVKAGQTLNWEDLKPQETQTLTGRR